MVLSNEHYRAIGRISVMFSDVESWTSSFIWQLICPDQFVGQMVTAGMSFPRQLDLLISLFLHRFADPSQRESLKELTKRISELEQKRNMVMHSTWILQSSDPNEATRFKITATRKRGLHQSKEITTPAELDTIADGFQKALSDLCDLMIPLVSTLPQN
jgi:wobble nucleotide-excising tRNase